jgi:hypothetical protein
MIRRLAMCAAMAKVSAMSGAVPASALLLAFALSGCGHIGNARAFPLYPNPDKPRPTASLAHLQGPIGWVDAIDVEPYGTVFDVLPGCHVVTLRRKVGASDVSGAWVADLGTMTYVFWMKPDHLYTVDVSTRFRGASHGTMTITAEERDPSGTVVNVVPQARRTRDIEACQDWQAATTLAAKPPSQSHGSVSPLAACSR